MSLPPSGVTGSPERLGIGLIGAGRVGCALASALRAAGHAVVAVAAHSPANDARAAVRLPGVPVVPLEVTLERSQLLLFAIPDDVLPGQVDQVAGAGGFQVGQLVVHTSGRYGLSVLEPAARAGAIPLAIHPAMTFTGTSLDERRLTGAPCAVTAPPLLTPVAEALVLEMGGSPVEVGESHRALYHAALSHGANHLVTLVEQAALLLHHAGIDHPHDFLRPLVSAALDNALRDGGAALTGPVARADASTVAAHRAAMAEAGSGGHDPNGPVGDILAAYDAMAQATTHLAQSIGRLSTAQAQELRRILASPPASADT